MRSGRLLTLLLLLQARGRVSATRLASELEVSVRTVLRDIDELSASGVPVRSVRGADGGFELLEGWRTRLTGLTPEEAQAMFMAGASGPAAQLGLGEAATTAQLKMLAALPQAWQADARRVSSRFHLDTAGWYRREERPAHLLAIAEALWTDRRLAIRYDSWKAIVDRVVDPLGLVVKAGEWYLVAAAGKSSSVRTYKLTNVQALEVRGHFTRPRKFDLATYWGESIARFETGLYRGTATLRATAKGLKRMRNLSAAVAESIDRATVKFDRQGWCKVSIPIESVEMAANDLLRVGAECKVLQPAELRDRVAETVAGLARLYGSRSEGRS
ncbi:MAG TPA: WYL domain-containing protein [Usitatibacter sp.]|jgi:predicted DNA-binding transcriptional regulator YafY|nr:WYL domain-containing protein [Usitatibacter sp.]